MIRSGQSIKIPQQETTELALCPGDREDLIGRQRSTSELGLPKYGSPPGATSTFISEVEEVVHLLSDKDAGPFHLLHVDFGIHNVIIDDEYNILSLIDWEQTFVGPAELAAVGPWDLRTHFPKPEDEEEAKSNSFRFWERRIRNREIFLAAVEASETVQGCTSSPKLSKMIMGPKEDILSLLRRWQDGVPWLLTYDTGRPGDDTGLVRDVIEKLKSRLLVG